ncbi:MAG: hypothetical protein LUQ39_05395 [Methanomassiliicoccales archaeon]|nr:hypothetical protein [Methanomassiliicoccales archaeon]
MSQYLEADAPGSGAVSVEANRELIQTRPQRRLSTSVKALDDFIGGFPSSQVTLIDSSDRLVLDIVHLLCVNQVLEEGRDVVWVDGGNSVNPYALTSLCKRFRVRSGEVLESVNVSRAFTAYQLVTLIEEMMEAEVARTRAGLLVVTSFPDLFQDKDMWWSESLQLMKRCLACMREVTRRHGTVTLVTNLGLSKMLYKKSLRSLMYSSADQVLRIESQRAALRISVVNEGRSMLYHPVPYYQRTLDEFR